MSGIPDDFPVELLDAFGPTDWGAWCSQRHALLICTRPLGHTGDHVATSGEDPASNFCGRWSQ